eukprot:NODE_221_length_13987_cov_0.244888.p1 type:complete len:623 gc:universal NODE_221_length_13987_cov_0.244888:967-2835(+)
MAANAVNCFVVDLKVLNVHIYCAKLMLFHYEWYRSIVILIGTKETENSEGYENISTKFINSSDELIKLFDGLKSLPFVEDDQSDLGNGAFLGVEIIRSRRSDQKQLKSNMSNLVILSNSLFEFNNDSEQEQFESMVKHAHLTVQYYQTIPLTLNLPFPIYILDLYYHKPVLERAMYSGPLNFTDSIYINIKLFCKSTRKLGPSLHRMTGGSNSNLNDLIESISDEYNHARDSYVDNNINPAAADNQEQSLLSTIKAYKYANQFVSLDESDWKYLKNIEHTSSGIQYIGSIDKSEFRIETCISNVYCVKAQAPSEIPFQAFLMSLVKSNKYALLRVQTRVNVHEKLAVLRPVIENNSYFGYLQYLPYQQDVRKYSFPNLPVNTSKDSLDVWKEAKPSLNTVAAIQKIIVDGSEDSFDPSELHLVSYHHIYHTSLLKCIGITQNGLCSELEMELKPSAKLVNSVIKHKDLIPQQDASIKVIKKVNYNKVQLGTHRDMNKLLELALQDSSNSNMVEIGEASYVEDFQKALNDGDLVTAAVEEMMRFIESEISKGNDETATNAILVLRSSCPNENESNTFNEWLTGLRSRNTEAFEYMKYKQIMLISELEAKDSKLSVEHCNKFYN